METTLTQRYELLKKVQRRATKLIKKIENKSYEERLKYLILTTLETRRIRNDLIETFKIVKWFDSCKFFTVALAQNTRGHNMKLYKPACRLIEKYAFSNMNIDAWNGLTEEIIAYDTINSFKNWLDKFLKSRGFI